MNNQEALTLIGARAEETWEEDLVNQLFEIKQFILKTYHTPQVCWSRSKKLQKLSEAQAFLSHSQPPSEIVSKDFQFITNYATFGEIIKAYRNFEQRLSKLKLDFLNAKDVHSAAQLLSDLGYLEHQRLIDLTQLAHQLNWTLSDIKLSSFVNSGEIIRELLPFEKDSIIFEKVTLMPIFSTELSKSLNYSNFTKK
jgi:hypothetical protein